MKKSTKRLTILSLFTAVAILFSYVELVLPPILPSVPGIKMGLPNIIIIFLLYKFSLKEAAAVSFIRVFLICIIFGNFLTLAYSLAGAILSLLVMVILKRVKKFSPIGVSVAGGVCHNLGQVLVAMAIMQTREIGYYMFVLSFSGVISGTLVGIAAVYLMKFFDKQKNIY
jgi:heptaprenyl diphosphate synthase